MSGSNKRLGVKTCLNCKADLIEEESFWYCSNRACWKHLGFIFHVPKDVGYAQVSLNYLKEMWKVYEEEETPAQKRY